MTYLRVEMDLYIGEAPLVDATDEERHASRHWQRPYRELEHGKGGVWLCYSDLTPDLLAPLVRAPRGVGSRSHSGSGLCVSIVLPEPAAQGMLAASIVHAGDVVGQPPRHQLLRRVDHL